MNAEKIVTTKRGDDIEFKVSSVKIDKVKKGPNKNKSFVTLELVDTDFFADSNSDHKDIIFISDERIPQWEKAAEDVSKIPTMLGCDIIVSGLPAYRTYDTENKKWRETTKTTMRIFSRIKAGLPVVDAYQKAIRILTTMEDRFSIVDESELEKDE